MRELIDLLDDPTVRGWIEQRRSGPPAPAPVMAADDPGLVSMYATARLMTVKRHLLGLSSALPRVPDELHRAGSVLMLEQRDRGLVRLSPLIAGFALLGLGCELLVWRATGRVRTRLIDARPETVNDRLRLIWRRFMLAAGLVLAFALGSVGSFLAFDWPPLLRTLVLGYLIAFLAVRLALVLGRFLLAPKVERFRIVPVTTSLARFWYRRLALIVGWFAFGYITVEQLEVLGVSLEARQIIGYALGLGLLALGLESVWRSPRSEDEPGGHGGAWLLSGCLVGLWLLWVAQAMAVFWLVVVGVALPKAMELTRRSVRHVLRPSDTGDTAEAPSPGVPGVTAVILERGARAVVLIGAALLLSRAWNIDLIELSSRDTTPTRLLRGVLNASLIVLVADLAWHVAKAVIDGKLAQPRELGDPDGEEARRLSRLRTLLPILRNMLFITVVVVAGLMVLSAMGVEIAPLIAGAGVVGVAIGFGAQTLVKDIISGMFYLLDDAFRVGEYIQSGSYKGTVESFSLRSVKLRHHRGPLYTVPFGDLGAVQNMSRDWVIDKLSINVPYDTDLAAVKKIIKRIGAELASDPEFAPHVIETLKMQGVEQFGDFAIQIRMKMMTKPGEQFVIRRRAYASIKTAFEQNGIHFAFPTVHVSGGSPGAPAEVENAVGHVGLELVRPPAAAP
ncbi:mechanosensitive ion channel protein [Skermanella stibiiresistens SB22]|uniref:Mechanosensitive ion channel protein n=1 Tax=Skermanella stibiiresistens SB22 TaxID=1385369 RepID=W9GY38_9PROT|nr:mechanosensitive ion channel protein [Skermanella stibiiresistens SB22]